MRALVSAWQWGHHGSNLKKMNGAPLGIAAVLKFVVLSKSNILKDGNLLPSIPVFTLTGATMAETSVQATNRSKQITDTPESCLNLTVESRRRMIKMAMALIERQAVLKSTCCFGGSCSRIPPQPQEMWLSIERIMNTYTVNAAISMNIA